MRSEFPAGPVFVLTGAGISVESGMPTFRERETGVYAGASNLEDILSTAGIARDPTRVHVFHNRMRRVAARTTPDYVSCILATEAT